jgi:predicted metal-dependent HD superfamily phosphohydrolase
MEGDSWGLPGGLRAEVWAAYGEAHRAYHGVGHLEAVLARHAEVARAVGWERPREALLALLFHDVVYVPGEGDNEARSAEVARASLARWWPDAGVDVEEVARLVLLTARHGRLARADVTRDEALLLDCDLASLGGTAEEYDAYEAGVAREYAALPPEVYRAGRRRFLEGLLQKERLFLSDFFHARCEAAARAHLRRVLAV